MKFWLVKPTALPVAKKKTHRKLSRLPKKIFKIPSRIFKQVPTGSSCPCFFLNKEMQFWQSRPGALPAAPGRDTQTPLFLVSGKPRGDTLSSCTLSPPSCFPRWLPRIGRWCCGGEKPRHRSGRGCPDSRKGARAGPGPYVTVCWRLLSDWGARRDTQATPHLIEGAQGPAGMGRTPVERTPRPLRPRLVGPSPAPTR